MGWLHVVGAVLGVITLVALLVRPEKRDDSCGE